MNTSMGGRKQPGGGGRKPFKSPGGGGRKPFLRKPKAPKIKWGPRKAVTPETFRASLYRGGRTLGEANKRVTNPHGNLHITSLRHRSGSITEFHMHDGRMGSAVHRSVTAKTHTVVTPKKMTPFLKGVHKFATGK